MPEPIAQPAADVPEPARRPDGSASEPVAPRSPLRRWSPDAHPAPTRASDAAGRAPPHPEAVGTIRTVSQRDATLAAHTELRGHVVVCGLEGLGLRVVEELDRLGEQRRRDSTRRARRALLASALTRLGASSRGRGRSGGPGGAPCACGIPGARARCSPPTSDVANIHGALAAASLDPGLHVVLRAFDEEFGRQRRGAHPGCRGPVGVGARSAWVRVGARRR